jgi:hypothetical protein
VTGSPEQEFLMLGPDPPFGGGFAAALKIGDQLPLLANNLAARGGR